MNHISYMIDEAFIAACDACEKRLIAEITYRAACGGVPECTCLDGDAFDELVSDVATLIGKSLFAERSGEADVEKQISYMIEDFLSGHEEHYCYFDKMADEYDRYDAVMGE